MNAINKCKPCFSCSTNCKLGKNCQVGKGGTQIVHIINYNDVHEATGRKNIQNINYNNNFWEACK